MKKILLWLLGYLLLLTVTLAGLAYYAYSKMIAAERIVFVETYMNNGPPDDDFYKAYWWWKQARLFNLSDQRIYFSEEEWEFQNEFRAIIQDTLVNRLDQYIASQAPEYSDRWFELEDSLDQYDSLYHNIYLLDYYIQQQKISFLNLDTVKYRYLYHYLSTDPLVQDFYHRWERFIHFRWEENRYFCAPYCDTYRANMDVYRTSFNALPYLFKK